MRVMKLLALSVSYNRYAINAFNCQRHHLLSRPSISSSTALNKYRKVKWTPQSGAYVSLPHFNPHKGLDNNGPTSYAPHDNYGVTTSFSSIAQSLEEIGVELKGMDDGTATQMDLQVADTLSNYVIEAVKRNNFAPIVVTVVDIQANILVQKKMDGCVGPAFPEFSYAKAYTCVALNVSSREFRDKYTKENDPGKIAQLNSFMAISGKFAAFPGGVLLRNGDGQVIGAIGVSGAAGDEDEYGALRGVWDSGLAISTWPEEHSCATASD